MRNRRRVVLTALGILLITLVLAGPVAAISTKTDFYGTWIPLSIGDCDREWYPGGNYQARGCPLWLVTDTDNDLVNGEWLFVFDDHFIDPEEAGPWNGTFHGEVACADGTPGFWDGTFTGQTPGYLAGLGGTITCRGLGSGCVEGMKTKFEVYNLAQVTLGIEGYIHDPQGG